MHTREISEPGRTRATGAPTHYEVLGVRSSADLAQIRAGYVRQLKRCHPDSPDAKGAADGTDIQRLVRAYNTLKDRRKRAAYDAELRRSMQLRRNQGRSPKLTPPGHNRGQAWNVRIPVPLPLLLAVAALAVGLFGLALYGFRSAQADRGATLERDRENIPSPARLEPVARLAATVPVDEAIAISSRCFRQARNVRALSAADRCVAFDAATVYWRQNVGDVYFAQPYFQPQAVQSRADNAFPGLDHDSAMVRAASVRASTFEALLRVVDSVSSDSADDVAGEAAEDIQVSPPPTGAAAPRSPVSPAAAPQSAGSRPATTRPF